MSKQTYTIGFANQDEKNPFAIQVREHFQQEVDNHPELQLVVRDNDANTERALANAEEFAAIPVDLAVLFHVDERAGAALVSPLMRKQIPVIAIDIPLSMAVFFGINARSAGTQAGEALALWVQANWDGEIDKVLVMTEYRVLDVVKQRFDYALDALASGANFSKDSLLFIDNGGDSATTIERVSHVMQSWHDQRRIAILCLNDNTASSVLEAVRMAEREQDVAVLSYDGTPIAIEEFRNPDSRLIVSPSFRADEYGRKLVDLSRRILSGEKVAPNHYVEPLCLTRENFEAYV